jgi:hypothetical protein
MDGLEMNVNIRFVIQKYPTIYYLAQELKMDNVFIQIIVIVIQVIHLLTVHYIIVITKNLMIQKFALEMEIAFLQIIVNAIMNTFTKIVNIQFVII